MMANQRLGALVPVGDFKFIINADRATVKDILAEGTVVTGPLHKIYGIYKYVTSREPEFKAAVNEGLGGGRVDQEMGGIELGSLHVVLHCFTRERFLKVFEDYKSEKIKERLAQKFSDIGIETEGLVVGIENSEEVEEKAEALKLGEVSFMMENLSVRNEGGDFKFRIDADRTTKVGGSVGTIQLSRLFEMFNYITSNREAFNSAVKKSFGGDRADQQLVRNESNSLHVILHCFTNERFFEVFEEYKTGKIKKLLNIALMDLKIETEGLMVRIENTEEVEKKAADLIKIRNIYPQIIVQGGAYKERLGCVIDQSDFKKILKKSAKEGYEILIRGGTAVDAVEAAVRVLEDNEHFNAGHGSLLNNDGEVECDAMIMDGDTLNSGAVTSVSDFQNPVSLAKLIMEKSYHCGLSGEGALKFAKEKGFPLISDTKQLITTRSKNYKVSYHDYGKYVDGCMRGKTPFQNETAPDAAGEGSDDTVSAVAGEGSGDTVSAIARDAYGHFACAVSTGGVAGKLKGRVSDASMVGCGGYANEHGAATTSGLGESIIQITLAREVVYKMEGGKNAQVSARESLEKMERKLNDVAGIIAIDKQGNFGKFCTTQVMGWASIKDKRVKCGMNPNDVEEEQL